MRNISFFLTTQQYIDYLKDITRRFGWITLLPGQHLMAVEKAQGLGKGGKIRKLGECICISNVPEPLNEIIKRPYRPIKDYDTWSGYKDICPHRGAVHAGYYTCAHVGNNHGCLCLYNECPGGSEVVREGFPKMTPQEFVEMFCKANSKGKKKCYPETVINRIQFKRVD